MELNAIGEFIAQNGISVFLVLYLIVWQQPRQMRDQALVIETLVKSFREEMATERGSHSANNDRMITSMHGDHEKICTKLDGVETALRARV